MSATERQRPGSSLARNRLGGSQRHSLLWMIAMGTDGFSTDLLLAIENKVRRFW